MNRIDAIRTASLIALPFLLLPAAIWLAVEAPAQLPAHEWQQVVRWSLRALYIGGAILGRLAGRPIWFYPRLGFAVYEAVAVLMLLVFSFVPEGQSLIVTIIFEFLSFGLFPDMEETVPRSLLLFLFLLVFSPYFGLYFGWAGRGHRGRWQLMPSSPMPLWQCSSFTRSNLRRFPSANRRHSLHLQSRQQLSRFCTGVHHHLLRTVLKTGIAWKCCALA